MDFALSQEAQAIFDMAHDFGQAEIAPHAQTWEREGTIPKTLWPKLAELGFGGLYVPEDKGGSGLSRLEATLVFEALYTNSRAHWNSTVHGLTCNVVKLFMEMDAKLFDECSADYREKQEKLDEVESAKQNKWISIKEMAEKSPLYAKTKNRLEPTSSLAYAMRLTSIQKGQTMFDDGSSLDNLIVQKFGEISIAPTTDALRRKSTLPTKKKDGE